MCLWWMWMLLFHFLFVISFDSCIRFPSFFSLALFLFCDASSSNCVVQICTRPFLSCLFVFLTFLCLFLQQLFFLELHFCGWQGHSFCIATTWQCCQKFYESVFVGAFCFHFFWLKKESHMVFFFSCIFLGGRDTLFLISWVFSNSFVEVFVVALVSCFVSSSHLFKNWDILRSVAMHMRFFPPVWNSIFFLSEFGTHLNRSFKCGKISNSKRKQKYLAVRHQIRVLCPLQLNWY